MSIVVSSGVISSVTTDLSGTGSSFAVPYGGIVSVGAGGVTSGDLMSGGVEIVDAGGSSLSATVVSGGTEYVLSGGVAVSAAASAGGSEVVSSGGSAVGVTIAGGTFELQSGGVTGAINFDGAPGGIFEIDGPAAPGVLVDGATISGLTAGDEIVVSGIPFDPAGSITLGAGNQLQLTESGSTYDLNLDPNDQSLAGDVFVAMPPGANLGATEIVVAAQATGDLVHSGQALVVSSGQTSTGVFVDSGGYLLVQSGGTATSAGLAGMEIVYAGGVDSGTTLSSGVELNFGSASGTVVSSGTLVEYAGTDTGTVISAGIEVVISGKATSAIVSGGELVESGGTDTGTVLRGGSEFLVAGLSISPTVDGGVFEVVGGTVSGAVVSGGSFGVFLGSALDTTVAAGGAVFLAGAGGVLVNGLTVESGGTLVNTGQGLGVSGVVIDSGGTFVPHGAIAGLTIDSGGVIADAFSSDFVVSTGGLYDFPGFGGSPVSSGHTALVLPGLGAYGASILSGGSAIVYSSGTAVYPTVSSGAVLIDQGAIYGFGLASGGTVTVLSGGTAVQGVIAAGGTEIVSSGGSDADTSISGVQLVYGTAAYDAFYDGGAQTVLSGGIASFTSITGSGSQIVSGGGSAVGIYLDGSATQTVLSGGFASRTVTLPSGGGTQIIRSGGSASGTILNPGGSETIDAGGSDAGALVTGVQHIAGTAISPTIAFTGQATVFSGGVVSNAVLSGGTLDVQSGATVSGAITFSGGVLEIDGAGLPVDPAELIGGAVVSGFVPGDTIDLTGISYDAAGHVDLVAGNELEISENGQTYDLQLAPGQNFAGDFFHLGPDAGSGTLITEDQTACYCRGTLIRTPDGAVAVEDLAIGDPVVTLSGAAKPVKWIGRRSYGGRFIAGNRDVLPIVIAPGALADRVPRRELRVSPEHALYLDGVLVPARHLVNGVSIVQAEAVDEVEYCHVELDAHDVVFAEGAPAETYVDDGNRLMFSNAAEFRAVYPEALAPGPALYCAPRVEDGERLETVRRALSGRAQRLCGGGVAAPSALRGHVDRVSHEMVCGWALDAGAPATPVTVVVVDNGAEIARVVADGYRADLELAGIGGGRHGFACPVPGGLAAGARHEIAVYAAADWTLLPGCPVVLEPLATPPSPAPLGALRGAVDTADRSRLTGWAQDEADAERPVGLVVHANGQVVGRVLANRYRADLADAGMGSGRHAFELVLPCPLSPLERQEVSVTREADGAELFGSPIVLPASGGFDAAAVELLAGLLAGVGPGEEEERALAALVQQTDRLLARRAARESGRAEREAHRLHCRRWGDAAAAPPPAGRRALVIDERVPSAGRDAGSVAILSHIRALQTLGYAVSFVAAEEIGSTAALVALGDAAGIGGCGAPYYSCVEDVLARQAGTFDLVYLHRLANAERYLSLVRHYNPRARVVYAVADLHHRRLARQAAVEGRPELLALSRRVAVQEALAARQADIVVTHSPVEAEWLRRQAGTAAVRVVPFAVARRPVRRPFAARHGIALVGGFFHAPNPDAVHHLLGDVLPLVWRQAPGLTCKIAGEGWSPDRLAKRDPRVAVLGRVDDLDALFDTVRLTVAPLRFGAGIKGKVIDSFAAGLPCVMTPMAAEGLPLPPTLGGLVGEDPSALAALILHHHADEAANTAAGGAGSRLAAEAFTDEHVVQALAAALRETPPARLAVGA
ncbi:MAG TPA: Hint domain-containing protein [Stellaceae bacterium]|nr:Hint domain-containing protein [Stellaceae bacterium]